MAVERRRLGLAHFAFYRAYLERADTVDLPRLADQYLDVGRDARVCRSIVAWLQDEFTAAARRLHDRDAERLLRLPKRLGGKLEAIRDAPSLDAFREAVDAQGVYGEAELLALYRQAYPDAPRSRQAMRDQRLRARRLEALRRLETAIAEPPAGPDPVAGWLDPAIARRLYAAGIVTLAQLVETINASGHRWYRHVPRVGPRAAARVVRWLGANAASVTPPFDHRALVPVRRQARAALMGGRPPFTQLAPLETLILPADLSGVHGENRAPRVRNRTGAEHDLAALDAWLAAHRVGSHTWRSYRVHAERVMLWSAFERGKPLSAIDQADVRAYAGFLSDPPSHWRGKRATPRWSAQWRPFAGPLSSASRTTALGVVKSLFQWLVDRGYLNVNPWIDAVSMGMPPRAIGSRAQRALTPEQWNAVIDDVSSRFTGATRERARFMLLLGHETGLLLSEMAGATVGWVQEAAVDDTGDAGWAIHVPGEGRRTRRIPFSKTALTALRRYLVARGLPEDLSACPRETPLIARLTGDARSPLGEQALATAFKKCFADAARRRASDDADAANRLMQASARWLRHTHGARAIASGVPLETVREHLGHASAITTAAYLDPRRSASSDRKDEYA